MAGKARNQVTLTVIYHELARRVLMHQTPEEMAQGTRIPLETLKVMLRRDDFKRILEEVRDKTFEGVDKQLESTARNIQQEIREKAAPKAYDKLMHLLDNAVAEGIQMRVSQDLLDRAGIAARQPAEGAKIQVIVGPVEADVIMTSLKKEEEGRKRLEAIRLELAKPVKELSHPSNQPSGGETSRELTE